ncbi:asparagine synthase-related protein (plasmid) [Streptomyces olivoreticuli]|uniref:asparagine synthase-related protein n=1 Tax=Streptomyces olivoreticuli TaxID=68246 RepID=UPI00265A3BC0|nr:asparagine synthase-related protein [Streptomyces olivoreticuli]WKK27840.1 asparagine synthase-related protein [Streptomyces olivoreticuli]
MNSTFEVMWTAGTGPGTAVRAGGGTVRTAADGPVQLTVVGECAATAEQLHAALGAVADGQWAQLTMWPGSYWVIADRPGERLVSGDLAGARGVFYTLTGEAVRWASRARDLTDGPPDLPLLAARLVATDHWPDRSPYPGVRAVPGGRALLLTLGGLVRLVDVAAVPGRRSLAEGAPAVGQALTDAVALRMRTGQGPVGADLSGGLDSSTAVLLAAPRGEVQAVTYSDPYTSSEDVTFAVRVAEHAGIGHHITSGGPEQLPFDFPDDVPAGDEPCLAAANSGMDAAYLDPVAGLRCHLTGHGGDVVLSINSARLAGLLQVGHRHQAHRKVVAWARAQNAAPGPLWQQVKDTSVGYPYALAQAADQIASGGLPVHGPVRAWSWVQLGAAASWLTGGGRDAVAELLRQAAHQATDRPAVEFAQWDALHFTGACVRAAAPLDAFHRVRTAHPFLDNGVVRAAFAVDPFNRPLAFKALLAAALPELPPWLTGRQSKGNFTAWRLAGLARHLPRLRELVRTSPLVTEELLDAGAAIRSLEVLARGEHAVGLAELHTLLVTCRWLASPPVPVPATGSAEGAVWC